MSRMSAFDLHHFAVKEHHARSLHWDLRLQFSGKSLLSFALHLPPNLDPDRPLIAIKVADHNLEHLFKEWVIPPGRPGAGPTVLWDRGFYRALGEKSVQFQVSCGHVAVEMFGSRLKGKFRLRWVGPEWKRWALEKEWDGFADPPRCFPNVLTPEKILELTAKKSRSGDTTNLDLFPAFQNRGSF
ncbi:MAG TPA: DNA polymerase ligase N-terminal domain-containing protein [bacterium]|nr:DNA polymerase ligase N-terminal domain-containing protein [bacterium]